LDYLLRQVVVLGKKVPSIRKEPWAVV
jgi:hypothetical protein